MLVIGNENKKILKQEEFGEVFLGITVEILNNEKNLSSRIWLEESPYSNFPKKEGLLTTTHIDGKDAVRYTWSTSYTEDSFVVATSNYLYVFSARYEDYTVQKRDAFEKIVASVVLSDPSL